MAGICQRHGRRKPEQWDHAGLAPSPHAYKALVGRLEALDTDIQREANRREKAKVAQPPEVMASIDTVSAALLA